MLYSLLSLFYSLILFGSLVLLAFEVWLGLFPPPQKKRRKGKSFLLFSFCSLNSNLKFHFLDILHCLPLVMLSYLFSFCLALLVFALFVTFCRITLILISFDCKSNLGMRHSQIPLFGHIYVQCPLSTKQFSYLLNNNKNLLRHVCLNSDLYTI